MEAAGGVQEARKHRLNAQQQQQQQQHRRQEKEKKVAVEVGGGGDSNVAPPSLPTSLPDPETYARSYQLDAMEMAMTRNTIAFLETGSGKTLIAIMLLRAHSHLLRRDPSSPSRDHSIAVFLTPTVILVSQQAGVIKMHTDLKVGTFWGDMGVDFWTADTWKEKLDQFEVFVMTPQILLNNLRHSFFKMDMIKLLVFDECHHAKGRHPYACIMTYWHGNFNKKHVKRINGTQKITRDFVAIASNAQLKYEESTWTNGNAKTKL